MPDDIDVLAQQVDEVLGGRVLADPETLWLHIEAIHGVGHALGAEAICDEMKVLGRRAMNAVDAEGESEFAVLMAQFCETQTDVLNAWLLEHRIPRVSMWIHHTLPDGSSFFKLWTVTP